MKLLKKFWQYIKYNTNWSDRFYIFWFFIFVIPAIFYAIPENNCKFWVDNLASAGLIPNRTNSGCYQAGLKYEQKQDYSKARYYFSEAVRKGQIICDGGRNKDSCPLVENSRKKLNRMIELEKNSR